jgi:hypothetical protein
MNLPNSHWLPEPHRQFVTATHYAKLKRSCKHSERPLIIKDSRIKECASNPCAYPFNGAARWPWI